MLRRNIAREHNAHLVGENLLTGIVDDAAAIAVSVKTERHIGLYAQNLVAHGVQHLHVFGVGIVFGKAVIELAVKRHHFTAERRKHLRREGSCRAVAARAHHLKATLELRAVGEIGDVAGGKILDELV